MSRAMRSALRRCPSVVSTRHPSHFIRRRWGRAMQRTQRSTGTTRTCSHSDAMHVCNTSAVPHFLCCRANGSFIQRASLSCLDLWECATQPNSTVALFHCDAEVSGECGGRNQQWIRTVAHELRSGLDPALCLDQYHLTATGRVDAFPCNGGANQQWHIEPLPHDPRFSLVRNVLSGLCLTGPPAPHSISLIARDLWLHRDIASVDTALGFTALVPANGASRMFRFRSLNTL